MCTMTIIRLACACLIDFVHCIPFCVVKSYRIVLLCRTIFVCGPRWRNSAQDVSGFLHREGTLHRISSKVRVIPYLAM
jgi:hypothetical protein